jgi:hypothetical protein
MITALSPGLPSGSPITFASTFKEYLVTLPGWDIILLAGPLLIELCYEILARLRNVLNFTDDQGKALHTLFVSGGSVEEDSMSFG